MVLAKGSDTMQIQRCKKDSFIVIGKEGSTSDGANFIQTLWNGIWGTMSDFSRSFHLWGDFSKGLYLAGVECTDDAQAPDGWTKWEIPGYEYIYVEQENDDTFSEVIKYLKKNDLNHIRVSAI